MTIREALQSAARRLSAAGVPDAEVDARLLLSHLLGESPLAMALSGERELGEEIRIAYGAMLRRREAREPLQTITGEAGFMGLTFAVTGDVLIPRPDTEILCEEAIRRLSLSEGRALDLGTGSGALAVSLALLSRASVTAVDVSAPALAVARENARRLGADVRFLQGDLFAPVEGERFDVIVSNPPYIARSEMDELMPEVRREPELALFGGEDGLDFYRRICARAADFLLPGGCLLLEIGWQQKEAVEALLREYVGEPFAMKDYGGNWRVVGAVLREEGHAERA